MSRSTLSATLSATPRSGTGMLAVFTDLAKQDQAAFRPWLVEEMFAARMAIGFHAAGSFDLVAGDGPEFVTLYDAPSLGDLYGEPYQGLRRVRSPMDAAYHKKFRNPDRFTLGWTGAEISQAGTGSRFMSDLFIDRFDLVDTTAQAFNIWFACDYLPSLAQLPGIARVRRYLTQEGSRAHFILHEFSDATVGGSAARESAEWAALRQKFETDTAQRSSGQYRRVVHAP